MLQTFLVFFLSLLKMFLLIVPGLFSFDLEAFLSLLGLLHVRILLCLVSFRAVYLSFRFFHNMFPLGLSCLSRRF